MGIEEFLINRAVKQGRAQEAELKEYAFVKTLLQDTDFNLKKIAQLASVSLAFVEKVKKELESK